MRYNAQQMQYLRTLGLDANATPEYVQTFVEGLNPDQKAFLDQLATPAAAPAPAPQPAAVAPTPAPVPAPAPSPEAIRAEGATAERTRIAHIRGVAATLNLGDDWARAQIDGGFTAAQVNAAALTQAAASRPPAALGTGPSVQLGADRQATAVGEALTDSLLLRFGQPLVSRDPGTRMPATGAAPRAAHPWAGRFHGSALMMAATYLQLCGRDITGLSSPQLAQAVFHDCPRVPVVGLAGMLTSADFPYLLANVAGISMQTRYAALPTQWPIFAVDSPANDFREQSLVQIGSLPILPEVKEGGEYTHVVFGETREVWTLAKRGHIVALSWEAILNDQLGAFQQMIAMEGDAAARTDDTLAFTVLTANANMNDGGALFNATAVTTTGGHANYVAHGSGAAPSVTTLNAGELAMGKQAAPPRNVTDTAVYLNLKPGVAVSPLSLAPTFRTLIASQYDPAGTAGTLTPNPWQGRLKLASHALLDAQTDSASWYLCTDPAVYPAMILGFLQGMRGPQMSQETGFDNDVRKYKVTHCRAAKATDWRAWYANHGH